MHESLISAEEGYRTIERNGYYVILPMLPELQPAKFQAYELAGREYDSQCDLMNKQQVEELLRKYNLLLDESSKLRIKQSLTV